MESAGLEPATSGLQNDWATSAGTPASAKSGGHRTGRPDDCSSSVALPAARIPAQLATRWRGAMVVRARLGTGHHPDTVTRPPRRPDHDGRATGCPSQDRLWNRRIISVGFFFFASEDRGKSAFFSEEAYVKDLVLKATADPRAVGVVGFVFFAAADR
jgi:hypothetical protein